jgi:hypothetical protein
MARGKKYHYGRTSKKCGRVTVHITPLTFHSACGKTQPVKVRVTQQRRTIWNPARPMCIAPKHDVDTVAGRAHAVTSAVKFLQRANCGKNPRWD